MKRNIYRIATLGIYLNRDDVPNKDKLLALAIAVDNKLLSLDEAEMLKDEFVKEKNNMKRCAICGCDFEGFGNNPYPIRDGENDRCCDVCNDDFVVPARVSIMSMSAEQAENAKVVLPKTSYKKLCGIFEV